MNVRFGLLDYYKGPGRLRYTDVRREQDLLDARAKVLDIALNVRVGIMEGRPYLVACCRDDKVAYVRQDFACGILDCLPHVRVVVERIIQCFREIGTRWFKPWVGPNPTRASRSASQRPEVIEV
jgi:hypothetical protein